MNNKLKFAVYPAVAVLSLVAAVAARADDITPDTTTTQVWAHTKTRTEVQNELTTARADGSMKVWSTQYDQLRAVARGKQTRDDVKAGVLAERNTAPGMSTSTRLYGEDSGSFYLSRVMQQQQSRQARDEARMLAGTPVKGAQQ